MATMIRAEQSGDHEHVRTLIAQAFGQQLEADLVDALRHNCPEHLSLVAIDDERTIVGHILFTPVTLDASAGPLIGMGLAPMSVAPNRQRQGIGSALVRQGITTLAGRDCPFVIVVGHPAYYPRFGFERASWHGVRCPWDTVPDEAFMIRILDAAKMHNASGLARYRDEFNDVA